ncbi:TPA: D-alanine--D-alanine ligase [Patescibacteria group bacterium]|nr:MAG: D-alanine-D-alanine ligase [Parcubacteria group bacterium GW2011_GWD2_42_14]HCC05683.1 D-alanine--D-alanine ligase [Patescibacteria group bacterium]
MYKMRVGVLRGGPSAEYEVSLKTGQSVIQNLSKDRYEVKDILIDKAGKWHMRGMPVEATRALDQVDVVFNALHGKYGEDGEVQRFLDSHGSKYTGSGSLASAIAMNKVLSKGHLSSAPFKHAPHRLLHRDEMNKNQVIALFQTFPQPCIVKPVSGGSSIATALVSSFDELLYALTVAFSYADQVLVEKYIKGREATVAVADGFRGQDVYAFPPIEIITSNTTFFDYTEKYGGNARELCPAPFTRETTDVLLHAAKHVHKTLGLRDYSRSDFIVARDGVYFLEVNSLPGLTPTSLLPKTVEAVGATLPSFLGHLVERAYARK